MINNVTSIALSGMQAASRRLENSSNNVANLSSAGSKPGEAFRPQRVTQSSLEEGGVTTSLQAQNPATFKTFDPTNPAADADGLVEYPNVNLEEEAINQHMASYDFKANIKSIKTEDQMMKALLDITA